MTALRANRVLTPARRLAVLLVLPLVLAISPSTAHADTTPPVTNFVQWSESSPYAFYDSTKSINTVWFNPTFTGTVTATVNAVDPETGVDYVTWPTPPSGWSPAGSNDSSPVPTPGIIGTYWDNSQAPGTGGCTASPRYPCSNFTGINYTRVDPNVDFNWGSGTPYAALGIDTFSIRWTGKLTTTEAGTYYFQARADDGVRVWIDGTQVVAYWNDESPTDRTQCPGGINLGIGTHDVVMEFYENGGGAEARLRWRRPSDSGLAVPTGCSSGANPPTRYATGWGAGSTTYNAVPSTNLTTGNGTFSRVFTWGAGASGGSINATATNLDTTPDTSAAVPFVMSPDSTPPVVSSGTVSTAATGWANNASTTLTWPPAANYSDAGASAPGAGGSLTREVQRIDGIADGSGGCDTSSGSWSVVATNPAGTSLGVTITANTCSRFRYVVRDAVGNELVQSATGFYGYDATNPAAAVTSIVPGANPSAVLVTGPNTAFVNTTAAGDLSVVVTASDAHSGLLDVAFPALAAGWAAGGTVTAPGPFAYTYAWSAGAASVGARTATARDLVNRSTSAAFTITADTTGPAAGTAALTVTPPGTSNATSVTVTMSGLMSDGGAGVGEYQLQRESAPWSAGACGTFSGTWTNIGSPTTGTPPAALPPTADPAVADNTCYRYRLRGTDRVGNPAYVGPSAGTTVTIDRTAPTGTLDAAPAWINANTSFTGTAADSMTGVNRVSMRYDDLSDGAQPLNPALPAIGTPDVTGPFATWGPVTWTLGALPDGDYNVYVDVRDVAGNITYAAAQQLVKVDRTAPTLAFAGFVPLTGAALQAVDSVTPNRLWVRTTGTTGSFKVTWTATEAAGGTGVNFVTQGFGAIGGWTPSGNQNLAAPGPYEGTLTWSPSPGNPGVRTATATDVAGNTSATVPYDIQRDNNAPTGGAITYAPTPGPAWHAAPSVTLAITNATDAGAGINVQRVERDSAPIPAGGTCATATWPGTFATTIGTPAATLPTTMSDTGLVSGTCYRYRLVAVDRVTNQATFGGTANLPVDTTAAAGTFTAPSAAAVLKSPPSVTVSGTATDGTVGPNSGVASVTVRWENLGDHTSSTIATISSGFPTWSTTFDTASGATLDGNYRLHLDVTDVAGNVATDAATRDVVIDNAVPTLSALTFVSGSPAGCQHVQSATTLFFSTAATACTGSGSFSITTNASAGVGGVQKVTFPDATYSAANITPGSTPADDASVPYSMSYSYTNTATSPASGTVTVTANSGATGTASVTATRDNVPPTGATLTAPGGTSAPAWFTNASSAPVAFNLAAATDGAGAGVRTNGHQLQVRTAPGPSCSAWGSWTNLGIVGAASPVSDTSLADGTCVQYRLLVRDNVSNDGVFTDAGKELHVDRTAPGGTLGAVPPAVRGTSVALGGTSSDDWSGVASLAVLLDGGPTTACTPTVAANWTCSWDSTTASNGSHTLALRITDVAGNTTTTPAQTTTVDNAAPTGTVTLTPLTSTPQQFVVGGATPRIYVKGGAGAGGTFTATVAASDNVGGSGVASVAFPALGTGFTNAPPTVAAPGPYTTTYTWTASATDPGITQHATIGDSAGNVTAASAPFDVIVDPAAPTGGSLDYPGGTVATPTLTMTASGDGAGSGVATTRIQRRATTLTGPGTCDTGAWSSFTDVGPLNPGSSWSDSGVTAGNCYQYQLVVTDNVGNVQTIADTGADTAMVEPAGILVTESGASTDITEGGITDTVAVTLRSAPTANVTVTLTPDSQQTLTPATLTFTPANWNTPRTVTVTAVDDQIDEHPDTHFGTITSASTSSDTNYASLVGPTITAHITDNDTAAFVVSPSASALAVAEAGATSDTYTVKLATKPTANVTITLANGDGQVTFSPAALTFTPANFAAAQTVTVTAVDDAVDETATHVGHVTHTVASSDPKYVALTIPDATANIADDDTAGVVVTPTSGLTLSETGPTSATYTVKLSSEPTAPVTIAVVGDAAATVTPTTLTFSPATWSAPQTVTMTAVDDAIAQGTHSAIASHTATSTDPLYSAIAISPVTASVTDNDTPGVQVQGNSGLAVAEGGAGASYQLRLASQPTANVTIAFGVGTQLQTIASLTFTSANWNAWQTVNVAAVDDQVDEHPNPHGGTISYTVTSADAGYGSYALANQSVDITDNDTAGVTVNTFAPVSVDEANVAATHAVTVVLDTKPTANVTVTPTADAQVTAVGGPLVFTPANWNVPQPVSIGAVNDAVDEADPHPGHVALAVASTDPHYGAVTLPDVVADVHDDDTAGVVVSGAPLAVAEGGATAPLKVHLASEPTGTTTITLAPDSQVSVSAPTMTFTTTNWATDQSVTVTAVDDPLVEPSPHGGTIGLTASGDPAYAALVSPPVSASITDNDTPGVVVTPTTSALAEGGASGTYTVVLARQPAQNVTVAVSGDAQVSVAPASLTFTSATWNVPQTVTMTSVDDHVAEPSPHAGTVTNTVSSTDPLWGSVTAPSVAVSITDNDVPGVTVTQTGPYALSESSPAPSTTHTYQVRLDTQPTANVTIALAVPGDLTASPASLSFTPATWNVDQTVTFGALDDHAVESPVHTRTITHAVTSSDPSYPASMHVDDVVANVTDNDVPGITLSKASVAVTEGGATDTYTVVMDTQPSADVTIALTGTQVTTAPASLTFTAANWNLPQTVTVTAVDDQVDEHPDTHAGSIAAAVTSADTTYQGFSVADVAAAITDNDVAAVLVTPGTGTPLAVAEAGATSDTYTVTLATKPTANVVITPATGDGQTTCAPAALTFTPANWNAPQTVTVMAVDDNVDEADPHPGLVSHAVASSDSHYASITVPSQPVLIADNDTAGVTVTPVSGLSLDEAVPAITASFAVKLDTAPSGNVTLTLATPDGMTSAAPTSLTFTPATWNVAQTVTVSVVDDHIAQGTHTGVVQVAMGASADPAYAAIDPADVTTTIADNDHAGVTVTESGASTDVDEVSLTDTYALVLTSQPTSDVTINVTGGVQASAMPGLVTFTAANWNIPQNVTVAGTPDFLVEGAHTQLLTHAATSADPAYAGIAVADVTAHITDDDTAGVDITPTSTAAVEGGTAGAYDVRLTAEPTANVVVTITPDAQVTPSAMTVTFTPANWNSAQHVTVTAVDDHVVEPSPHLGLVTHATTSSDPAFNALHGSDVNVAITDNDHAGVTVTPASTNATEGGAHASASIVLTSQPTAPVDVTFTNADGQLDAPPAATFTAANWNVPQIIDVAAHDDLVAEGAHSGRLTFDTSSVDASYATGTLTIPHMDVAITDNDIAGVLMTPASGLAGSEGGPVVSYDVSLTSQPTAPVTIALSGDANGAPSPTTLTFTPGNWNVAQRVDVTIVDDAIAEGSHSTTIAHVVTSTDGMYGALTMPNQVIAVTDNDAASIIVTPPAPLSVSESGATATYTVRLGSEPTANVVITPGAVGTQVTPSPTSLTFTAANWNLPQTVTVTAVDDSVAEASPHHETIAHTVSSSDPLYAAQTLSDMSIDIADNDTAGVVLAPTGPDTSVEEGGVTDTVDVTLASEPAASVTVTVAGDAQLAASPTTLTFTPANWSNAQHVTVTAVDDAVHEGPHTGTLTATSASGDPFYTSVTAPPLTANIADNDTPGVVVTPPAATTLSEDTPAAVRTYQVHLRSQPTAAVTVQVSPDSQVTATPSTVTFTAANWQSDQTVSVSAIDDSLAEADPHPGTVTHDTTSADPDYAAGVLTIDPVSFDIHDNDSAGVTITPAAPHHVAEGGATSTYDVVLDSAPTATVTIAPVSTQLDWSVAQLTFDASNWNVPQHVTLRAIDDHVHEATPHLGSLMHVVTSADTSYDHLATTDVTADIDDDDPAGLVLTPASGLTVDEAGTTTATYVATLSSMPTAPVTVTPATAAPARVTWAPTAITLDASNWNTGVAITVTGVPNDVDDGTAATATVTHALTSADTDYDHLAAPDEQVTVLDDDTAGVTVTATGAATDVAEDGSLADAVNVVLDSQPVANVTVTLGTADHQLAAAPATLTFTPANWNVPQPVAVTAVDDHVAEGPHHGELTVSAASTDPAYTGLDLSSQNVTANVTDNDVAAVHVDPVGASLDVTEGGAGDHILVTLGSEPTAPVTVTLTPDAQTTVSQTSVTLDASNWQTGVQVAVDAFDDHYVEGAHTSTITAAVTATGEYAATTAPSVTANVTDNDSAGVAIDLLGGVTLDEAHAATTDTFSVKLTSAPVHGTTVTLHPGNGDGQVTVVPATLAFDDTNWNDAQTVTVTVVDDQVDEASPHVGTVTMTLDPGSGDPSFDALPSAQQTVDAQIADDDTAGLHIDPAAGATVSEAGATTTTLHVSLTSQPRADVDVTVSSDAQVSVPGATVLHFTPADWNVAQDVVVTAVDDHVAETDPHTGTVHLDAASVAGGDPAYDVPSLDADASVDVADDDHAGVTLTAGADVTASEADSSDTAAFDVVLTSEPTAPVDVTLTHDSQITLDRTVLHFTPADWNVAQPVVATAVDDHVAEASPHISAVSAAVASVDASYASVLPLPVDVSIVDDDHAGVTVTQVPAPGLLDEAGTLGAATYHVVLDSEPTANVTIALADADGQVAVAPATLTFTPGDWNVAQPVSVTAVDDHVAEPNPTSASITHTAASADAAYDGAPVDDATFEITDDDVAGFHFVPASPSLHVAEAGATSDTYQLAIDTVPTSDVTVELTSADPDVTITPSTYTFTTANAADPVTVTVTAVDDHLAEGSQTIAISHAVTTTDPAYATSTIPDVPVVVDDDDTAGLVVTPRSGLSVAEQGQTTATFTVALQAEPTSDVTVAFDGGAQLADMSAATLTFTPGNWSDPQTVTITAVDDFLPETTPHPAHVQITTTSAQHEYDALADPGVDADVTDNDAPSVVVTAPDPATLSEADPAGTERRIAVRLSAQPTGSVFVGMMTDSQLATMSLPTLTFTPANWSTDQYFTIRAYDDPYVEAPTHAGVATFSVYSANDPAFNGLQVPDQSFDITDNDGGSATVRCDAGANWTLTSAGAVRMSEDVRAATHAVTCRLRLGAPSNFPVTVDVAVTPTTAVSLAPQQVVFDAGDTGPKDVTFTAVDDHRAQGDHHASITMTVTSDDPVYGAVAVADVPVDVADDDRVGVKVDPAGPLAIAEGGASATAKVSLTSEPSGPVTLTFSGAPSATAAPQTLTFSSLNWDQPQDVVVTAVDDSVDQGDAYDGSLRITPASSDADYQALVVPAVPLRITDNDTPGVSMTAANHDALPEAGGTVDVSVKLTTKPSADVVVGFAPDAQIGVSAPRLTFTPDTWDAPQTVTVKAVQDPVVEGPHSGVLASRLTSDDPSYRADAPATPQPMSFAIADDDTAGVVVLETEGATKVAEAGGTDTYAVALAAAPAQPITVAVEPDAQVTASPGRLTFTADNWNKPQSVTVAAVNDDVAEPNPHRGQINQKLVDAPPAWSGVSIVGVTAEVTDNDAAGITVTQTDDATSVAEGGATDTVTVQLTSEPLADVSVVVGGKPQLTATPDALTFSKATWKKPQTVTVAAVDDSDVEGDHQGQLVFSVSSQDSLYQKAQLSPIVASIKDNDIGDTGGDGTDTATPIARKPRRNVGPVARRPTTKPVATPKPSTSSRATGSTAAVPSPGLGTGPAPSTSKQTTPTIDSKVTAAKRANGPSRASETPVSKLLELLKRTWLTWLPILGLMGGIGIALRTVLHNDPMAAAQRRAGGAGARREAELAAKQRRWWGGRTRGDDDDHAPPSTPR